MSARPRDLYEGAGNFSLRSALAAPVAAPPQLPQSGGQLRFNLGSLVPPAPPQSPTQHHATPPIPTGQGTTQRFPQALNMRFTTSVPVSSSNPVQTAAHAVPSNIPNLSFTSMSTASRPPSILGGRAGIVAKQEHANAQADVMRLSAYVDELTTRLKKSQQKLQDTESQLHRTSHALASERHQGEATMKAYKTDLSTAHDVESKLRAELANRPKRSALTESHFMQSVGSVLQDEQREHAASEKLLELETKVKAMGDAKVLIESEIGALKELKAKAQSELADIRKNHEGLRALAATSENEMSEKVTVMQAQCKVAQKDATDARAALEFTKAEHTLLREKITGAAKEESQLVAAISSLNGFKVDAEAEAAAAKTDLQKMLLEHGDVSGKVRVVRQSLELLKEQEKVAHDGLAVARQKWTEASAVSASETNDNDAFHQQANLAKTELEGYYSKINVLREEIATAEEESVRAKATKQRIDVTKVELEGYEAKLEQVRMRLGESESALSKTTEKLRSLNFEVEKKEAIGAVPAFKLDASVEVSESLRRAMGANVVVEETKENTGMVNKRTSVFGASAPNKTLCTGVACNTAAIAAITIHDCSRIAALISIDAPPQMTLQRVSFLGDRHAMFLDVSATPSAGADPTAEMVNAVVSDLKTKLTEISEQQPVWRAVAPLA